MAGRSILIFLHPFFLYVKLQELELPFALGHFHSAPGSEVVALQLQPSTYGAQMHRPFHRSGCRAAAHRGMSHAVVHSHSTSLSQMRPWLAPSASRRGMPGCGSGGRSLLPAPSRFRAKRLAFLEHRGHRARSCKMLLPILPILKIKYKNPH